MSKNALAQIIQNRSPKRAITSTLFFLSKLLEKWFDKVRNNKKEEKYMNDERCISNILAKSKRVRD